MSIRGLTTSLYYGLPDLGTGRNPNWDAIGYPGPRSAPLDVPKPLRIRRPASSEEVIEADVCVVGSGAGGGVVAGELAGAGIRSACWRRAATTTKPTSTSSSSPRISAST